MFTITLSTNILYKNPRVAQENDTLRDRIVAGYKSIHEQESKLTEIFLNRASSIPGLKVYGKKS